MVPVTSDALWIRTSCFVVALLHSTKSHLIIGGIFYSSSWFGDSWRRRSLEIFFSYLLNFLFIFLWLYCFPVAFITTAIRTWHLNTKLEYIRRYEDTHEDIHNKTHTKNPAGLWALSREPFRNKNVFIYHFLTHVWQFFFWQRGVGYALLYALKIVWENGIYRIYLTLTQFIGGK